MIVRAGTAPGRQLEHLPIEARRIVGGEQSERLVVTHMTLAGEHPPVRLHGTETVYWVLGGSGWFALDGGPREAVGAGDAVLVPAGAAYAYGGEMSYLVLQSPPLGPDSVEFV